MRSASSAYLESIQRKRDKESEEDKPPKSLLREHFATILNVVVAAATSISGYFFVTSHNLSEAARKSESEFRKAETEMRAQNINAQQVLAKIIADGRSDDAKGAKEVKEWIAGLTSGKKNEVRNAAMALALGGKNNFPVIAAGLLYPNQFKDTEVKIGIMMAALMDRKAMCATLEQALEITDQASFPAIANSANLINCTEVIQTIEGLSKEFGQSPADAALKELKEKQVRVSAFPKTPAK